MVGVGGLVVQKGTLIWTKKSWNVNIVLMIYTTLKIFVYTL